MLLKLVIKYVWLDTSWIIVSDDVVDVAIIFSKYASRIKCVYHNLSLSSHFLCLFIK